MDAAEFVAQARQLGLAKRLVDMIAYRPRPGVAGEDVNEDYRRAVCLRFARDFGPDDREWLRCLLKQETAFHEQLFQLTENMYLCAWMVASLRHADDGLLLWNAKQANFSASLGLPAAICVAAGEASTRSALRHSKDPSAKAYLQWLQDGAAVFPAEVEAALAMLKSLGL